MKKNQLIKALVFTAVLAAFPAAGLTASAEDAAPADALAIDNAAPVAAKAEDVVLAPVEATPAVVETPVVVEATPAVDTNATATAEGTKDGKKDPCDPDTSATKTNPDTVKPANAPVAIGDVDSSTKATMDDVIVKAGNDTKITVDVTPGVYTPKDASGNYKTDDKGKYVIEKYKTAVRYFSSDNDIATVDADGTVHAKKPGKVTIWVQTLEGTQELTLNVSESYNVLLIDRTDSSEGKSLAKEKAAAISYSEEVLKINSESHIAVVQIGDALSTKTLSSFTNNLKDIKGVINGITAANEYSIYSAGLKQASNLLNSIPYYNQGLNKNIVIFGDGACTYGDRKYAEEVRNDIMAADDNVYIYAFGIYDSATDAEKSEGQSFLKGLASVDWKYYDKDGKEQTAKESRYYEFDKVADMKDTFKAIATKKTYATTEVKDANGHVVARKWATTAKYYTPFDVVVYGKDCGKKCGCKCDDKEAKKGKSEANSPETAESSSIYVIALFALLGAGAMGVSAKKRFED